MDDVAILVSDVVLIIAHSDAHATVLKQLILHFRRQVKILPVDRSIRLTVGRSLP